MQHNVCRQWNFNFNLKQWNSHQKAQNVKNMDGTQYTMKKILVYSVRAETRRQSIALYSLSGRWPSWATQVLLHSAYVLQWLSKSHSIDFAVTHEVQ